MFYILLIIIGAVIATYGMGLMIKKEMPEALKYHKKKWEEEKERKEKFKKIKEKEEKKITEIEKERKKKIFEQNRKQRSKKLYKENKKKGIDYEKYVSKYFKEKGYKVKEHGIENGKRDKGIDVIIMKNKEITLIQCKNWKENGRKIDHIRMKEFIGNCSTFLEKNKDKYKNKNYKFKKLYITSNKILDNSAKKYIEENKEIINYMCLPMI